MKTYDYIGRFLYFLIALGSLSVVGMVVVDYFAHAQPKLQEFNDLIMLGVVPEEITHPIIHYISFLLIFTLQAIALLLCAWGALECILFMGAAKSNLKKAEFKVLFGVGIVALIYIAQNLAGSSEFFQEWVASFLSMQKEGAPPRLILLGTAFVINAYVYLFSGRDA